jgi:hypothetical protein
MQALGFVGQPMQTSHAPVGATLRRKRTWLWIGFVLLTAVVGLLSFWGTRIIDPQYSSMFIYRLLCALALCLLCLALWLHERIKEGYGHIPVWPLAAYLLLTAEPPAFLRSGAGATIAFENVIIGLLFIFGGVYNHLLLVRSFQPIIQEKEGGESHHVTRL